MNKKKDLILDFTSLLDVTLLLLFFFILFSHLEVEDAKTTAENRVATAESIAQNEVNNAYAEAQRQINEAIKSREKYDSLIKENTDLKEKLENDIKIVNQVTSQEANEIIAFNSGNNLKMILLSGNSAADPLSIRVILNQKVIGESIITEEQDNDVLKSSELTPAELNKWLETNGIKRDSVVMCDLVIDGEINRTFLANERVFEIFDSLHRDFDYNHFYVSTTDLSVGRKKKSNIEEGNREHGQNEKIELQQHPKEQRQEYEQQR